MIPIQAEPRSLLVNYIYEASAGTGKTTTLVDRIVEIVAAGCNVEGIVAVTFTHAAAGEMKLRVRQELEKARNRSAVDSERKKLTFALQHLDRAFIGTIHSFCAQLLRLHPVEAEVDPRFQELSQSEAFRVFSEVFRSWIERKLASPSPVIRRALLRLTWSDEQETDPLDSLKLAAWKLVDWRDHTAPWSQREYDRHLNIDHLLEEVAGVVSLWHRCSRPDRDPLHRSLRPLNDFLARTKLAEELRPRDYDGLESELLRLPKDIRWAQSAPGPFGPQLSRDEVFRAWESLKAAIAAFAEKSGADLASRLRDELWEPVTLYDKAKRRAGQLDFMDLLLRARDLLQKDEPRRILQLRCERIFIDEFQDTDPLQAEILMLLACNNCGEKDWRGAAPAPGKLFIVGDPKQSIYRFRRADVGLYRDIAKDLEGFGVTRRPLNASQRSLRPIQDFVNAAFANKLDGYQPLEGGREPGPDQPAIVALPMPEPYGTRNIAKTAINACSPNAVAAFIEWLVNESNWTIEDRDSRQRRKIVARDICILFRRFVNNKADLTQEYVRCLESRGIAHVLVGSKSFHQREEVGTLRTALRAIEWPSDELSVFAVLHGSLFAIPDNTLLKFKDQFLSFHPFRALPEDLDPEFEPVRETLDLLAELHAERNSRPIAETINLLLEFARAHAGFAFRRGGERVLANVYRLADLAREFEKSIATSFRSFVEYLEEENEGSEMSEAPVLEQQANGVKLMTVHRAKGLEFPVVILADLTAGLTGRDGGDRYVDSRRGLCAQRLIYDCAPWEMLDNMAEEEQADRDEAYRVAYVAATRARDLLVVSAIGEKRFEDSWISPLHDALYPEADRWRRSSPAPGCPAPRGERTVLNRPSDYGNEEHSIRPGLHSPVSGTHQVVWFDPAWLALQRERSEGLANDALLTGTPDQIASGLADYETWKKHRREILEKGQTPSFLVEIASRTSRRGIEPEVVGATEPTRKSNRRFGRMVHSVLQHARDESEVEALCTAYARRYDVGRSEIPLAINAIYTALQHPLIQSAREAAKVHREFPVLLRLDDGALVEGRADLVYLANGRWTVIDFKTGSADDPKQLHLYAEALQKASGKPVRAFILQV